MISPQLGKAAFSWAILLLILSVFCLFIVRPGSAEFVITVITIGTALVFLGVVAVLVRVLNR